MVTFRKRLLDSSTFEAAAVFDVDGDGILDIVSGDSWYKGPDFTQKFKMCDVPPGSDDYFDDFSDHPMDVDGDGKPDIVTGGWWGETLRWRKNNGEGTWQVFDIDHCGSIETIRFFDIDGDGNEEVFPNTPGKPLCYYKLIVDAAGKGTGEFRKITISSDASAHGMGFGDINGDGLTDILTPSGWYEQPAAGPDSGEWVFHEAWKVPFWGACVPILAHDVTGNGQMDVIIGNGHGYGLYWLEQVVENGERSFTLHTIDTDGAQYHDMQLCDIDGDGKLELVTGKRWRAHCGRDPGDNDPVFIYIYKINGGAFDCHVVDAGDAEQGHSGVGIYFALADLWNDGRISIVAPGKEGLYLFEQNKQDKQA